MQVKNGQANIYNGLIVSGSTTVTGTTTITGSSIGSPTLYVANGGVQFGSTTGLSWDATNNRLGIGTNNPNVALHVVGGTNLYGSLPLSTYSNSTDKSGINFYWDDGKLGGVIKTTDYYTRKTSYPSLEIYGTGGSGTLATIPAISIANSDVIIGGDLKTPQLTFPTNNSIRLANGNAIYISGLRTTSINVNTGTLTSFNDFEYLIAYSNVTAPTKRIVSWAHSNDLATRYFMWDGLYQIVKDHPT